MRKLLESIAKLDRKTFQKKPKEKLVFLTKLANESNRNATVRKLEAKFEQFVEDNLGVNDKRPLRNGARHIRGHEPIQRYEYQLDEAGLADFADTVSRIFTTHAPVEPREMQRYLARMPDTKLQDLKRRLAAMPTGGKGQELQIRLVQSELKTRNQTLAEAPIQQTDDPMDPMIVNTKSNPAKLSYRMTLATMQLKDLATGAESASAADWQEIAVKFKELTMNINEIEHAISELAKVRRKGGTNSKGIDADLRQVDEFVAPSGRGTAPPSEPVAAAVAGPAKAPEDDADAIADKISADPELAKKVTAALK